MRDATHFTYYTTQITKQSQYYMLDYQRFGSDPQVLTLPLNDIHGIMIITCKHVIEVIEVNMEAKDAWIGHVLTMATREALTFETINIGTYIHTAILYGN